MANAAFRIGKVSHEEFDKDQSGVLEYPEFEKACIELEFAVGEDLHEFFENVDENNNGVVSFEEFARAILGETTDVWPLSHETKSCANRPVLKTPL